MRLSVISLAAALGLGTVALLASCADAPASSSADSTEARGEVEVLLTDPYCDVCTADDKNLLAARSAIVAKVIELVDGASTSVDVAQFTFSSKPIEAALLRAHERGVAVRLAMDSAQDKDGTVSRRLRDAGISVRFVKGGEGGPHTGIMHAKFMMVDGVTLLTGSNNWSSTGTSINEENTIVLRLPASDPRIVGHACQFEAIWARDLVAPSVCSNAGVAFSPSSAAQKLVRNALRESTQSIDVLMHHLTDQ
jgi:phosphatidylserine/phosphatidylglycerophosphate/cardiolipin synthase-like enzyme